MILSEHLLSVDCDISGVVGDDSVSATLNDGGSCFGVRRTSSDNGVVTVLMKNDCSFTTNIGTSSIAVIVYDK
jgi:hypothetical protein